jgi:glycine/D-amino acid oxidase-like deaminating enzyme
MVIGAGIMGCALAYDLALIGNAVVLDRGAFCGGLSV